MLRLCAFLFLLVLVPLDARALEPFPALRKAIPDMAKAGEAQFSFLFLDIYDIALFAPQGRWDDGAPYALSLRYHVPIEGRELAERSINEMRRQGVPEDKLKRWQGPMLALFPDVEEGTNMTTLAIPGKETRFFKNGRLINVIKDPDFAHAYLGMWLAENTSQPDVRARLIGGP